MVDYSNGAIFASEAIAMCITIFFGESILANELLYATKGHGMGWGALALGFGLAFGFSIFMFGFISARLNPAFALAELVIGIIDGGQFGCIIAGDFLGAFIGAVLVWLLYLPHFKSVPEAPTKDDNMLLRSKDVLADNALGFVSYNNREEDVASREQGFFKVQNALNDIKYYLHDTKPDKPEMHHELASAVLGHSQMIGSTGVEDDLRRHSIQVCDAHNRLDKVDLEDFRRLMIGGKTGKYSASETSRESLVLPENNSIDIKKRLAEAAIKADQNAKLSIFATRPAVYSPLLNFLTEFMATIALCYGALMIGERSNMLLGPQKEMFDAVAGFYLGFFVFLCVLALGGPTGLAVNPARDFSPRLAHWILPIPGKGPSEFYYCWIPILAPLVGGCAAAGLYLATQNLNKSNIS